MVFYFKLGRERAIAFDLDPNFGPTPFIARKKSLGEIIFDLPYCRVIYTLEGWTLQRGQNSETQCGLQKQRHHQGIDEN